MNILKIITFCSLILAPVLVHAIDGGKIETMQMPAWLERNGVKRALTPGDILNSGDIVSTGKSARLLIRLEEGSQIKLGENGVLALNIIQPPKETSGVFAGLLNVITGAFRFTTSQIGNTRKRDVKIHIGAVTAGIRGTDIWGRSSDEKDILCLIEGKITAQRQGETVFIMKDALSFYIAPKDKPALPVSPVPKEKLAKWAKQTETQSGHGVLTADGRWTVNVMSLKSFTSADKLQKTLNTAGYATTLQKIQIKDSTWHRISIKNFATKADARSFTAAINHQYGIHNPWIIKSGM